MNNIPSCIYATFCLFIHLSFCLSIQHLGYFYLSPVVKKAAIVVQISLIVLHSKFIRAITGSYSKCFLIWGKISKVLSIEVVQIYIPIISEKILLFLHFLVSLCSFLSKTLQKTGMEGTYLNIIKSIYANSQQTLSSMVKNWKHFL